MQEPTHSHSGWEPPAARHTVIRMMPEDKRCTKQTPPICTTTINLSVVGITANAPDGTEIVTFDPLGLGALVSYGDNSVTVFSESSLRATTTIALPAGKIPNQHDCRRQLRRHRQFRRNVYQGRPVKRNSYSGFWCQCVIYAGWNYSVRYS